MSLYTVYAVECADGSVYVGETANRELRRLSYQMGRGSKFVERHGFGHYIREQTVFSREEAVALEKEWVLEYNKAGFFTAGGPYTSDDSVIKLRKKLGVE